MPQPQVKLYYKNVMADVIGNEHGITPDQRKALAKKTEPLIVRLNRERRAGKTPYRDLPYKRYNKKTLQQIKDLTAELKGNCKNLVVLGIGGSALGNIALQTALNPYMYNLDDKKRQGPRLFVFDNADPAQFGSFLDWVEDSLDKTIFNVISKKGAAETLSQFMIVRDRLLGKFGPNGLRKQIIVTTDFDRNPLHEIAIAARLRCLEVPADVGGRFGVLSAVGLFSAAMCGSDIDEIDSLLAGACDMDEKVSRKDFYENPAAIIAAINWHFYNRGKKISVMMPYSYHLKDLADWYRQLWAESLGKKLDLDGYEVHIGPTPIKALGATDQHSQVQLYREGPNDKLFTFLQVRNFGKNLRIGPVPKCVSDKIAFLAGKDLGTLLNNEKIATEYALLQDKRPCLTIRFDRLNPYTVGQFIYLYEVTTSLAGALFNINPYDQPAVQLCKNATFALMGKPGREYRKLEQQIKALTKVDTEYLV